MRQRKVTETTLGNLIVSVTDGVTPWKGGGTVLCHGSMPRSHQALAGPARLCRKDPRADSTHRHQGSRRVSPGPAPHAVSGLNRHHSGDHRGMQKGTEGIFLAESESWN